MKKVSIITTVYNARDYLPLTIQSVLAQTEPDFELILVDDGSPNGCGEICDEWAAKDARIRVIHKKNGGPASASNMGLDAATGEYISFVDSDDLIEPDFLEQMLLAIRQSGCKIAGCSANVINEVGTIIPDSVVKTPLHGENDALHLFYDTFQSGGWYGMLCWNKLIAAELWQDVRFDESFFYGDDCNILHKIYDGQRIFCMDKTLYHYRRRSDSMTAAKFNAHMLDDLRLYKMWYEFLSAKPAYADLAQWGLSRYWNRFYQFYVQARQSNALDDDAKKAFATHMVDLKSLLPAIKACPHITAFEKQRAAIFCQSPALCYHAAHLWGRMHAKKMQGGSAN